MMEITCMGTNSVQLSVTLPPLSGRTVLLPHITPVPFPGVFVLQNVFNSAGTFIQTLEESATSPDAPGSGMKTLKWILSLKNT